VRQLLLLVVASCLSACSGLPPAYTKADAPTYVPPTAEQRSQTKLALVLGSGGPRGFAHIGAIKALHEAGIKPDLIVGSSIGAIIGAIYASGVSPNRLEQLAFELNATDVLDPTLSRWGWFKGEALQRVVNQQVGNKPIEQFPTRFVAVASKIPMGSLMTFNHGNAGVAAQASSALPGRFLPVRIGDDMYFDGDLISPVPIKVAKDLGAQIIIAIDVSADLNDTPNLDNIPIDWITTGVLRNSTHFHPAQNGLLRQCQRSLSQALDCSW
jgi:NTE family protein